MSFSAANDRPPVKVLFFPHFIQNDVWGLKGNPHIREIARQLEARGILVDGLNAAQFLDLNAQVPPNSTLYFHWTESLSERLYSRYRSLVSPLSYLGAGSAVRSLVSRKISLPLSRYRYVVAHIHELQGHAFIRQRVPRTIDDQIKKLVLDRADAFAVHERIVAKYLPPAWENKPRVWAPLGDYESFLGKRIERNEARTKIFGNAIDGRVLAYVGTARPNRNPRKAVISFQTLASKHPKAKLIIAGMGHRDYLRGINLQGNSITVYDGLAERDFLRDIFCAADFVIQDGENYMTSAIARTALSYELPVISYPYGCSLEMNRDCMISIEGNLGLAIERALTMSDPEYRKLVDAAKIRASERSWSIAGDNLAELFRSLSNP